MSIAAPCPSPMLVLDTCERGITRNGPFSSVTSSRWMRSVSISLNTSSHAITCGTPDLTVGRENDTDFPAWLFTAMDVSLCHAKDQVLSGGLSKNKARTRPKLSPNRSRKNESRISHCQTVETSGTDWTRFLAAYTCPRLDLARTPCESSSKKSRHTPSKRPIVSAGTAWCNKK